MLTCSSCGGLTPQDTAKTCLHCDAPLRRPPRWMLKLTALLGPAGSILLAACYGPPGYYMRQQQPDQPVRMDYDGDGTPGPWSCPNHDAACEAKLRTMPVPMQVDCDDRDPRRYPGADDPPGDGIDQNCDGVDGVAAPAVRAQ